MAESGGETQDVTFQVALLFGILGVVFFFVFQWLKKTDKKDESRPEIPGMLPSDKQFGNLKDIEKAGSLHEFLSLLHTGFGPVASFWMGETKVVSTARADVFKPQIHLFNRPGELFKNLEPLIGAESIQYQNYKEGKGIRNALDPCFSFEACSEYLPIFTEAAEETAKKWKGKIGEPLELKKDMLELGLKSILRSSFGDYFSSDEACEKFQKNYDIAFYAVDKMVADPELGPAFTKSKEEMEDQIKEIVERRRNILGGQELLIDKIINYAKSEEQLLALALTYVIGGYHTTGIAMAWLFYFISKNENVQEQLHHEMEAVLGTDDIFADACTQLKVSRNVIDETFRLSQLGPYAARFSDQDIPIGGHVVPKGTPILQALGVADMDKNQWKNPQEFDPSRFENESAKNDFTCPFFGFAGKRKCPAYRLSYFEILAFLSVLVRRFRVSLVDPEFVAEKSYGIVCHPAGEIMVKAHLRE